MRTSTWNASRPTASRVRTRTVHAIEEVEPADWNALDRGGSPFLTHEFLYALEWSGSASAATGWAPRHLLLERDGGGLVGAMPLYLKLHSYGEFVFDFAWAQAYARHGLDYYPKLVCATPFTPATGPRLLVHPAADRAEVQAALVSAARDLSASLGASSLHVLFPDAADSAAFETAGLLRRLDCQFHWRNAGYATFDDFLATFTAEKRKKTRRERRRVQESGLRFEELSGHDLDAARLDAVYGFYADTFARHGNAPYLNRRCFERLALHLPDALMVKLALSGRTPVACAIFFRGIDTLYGRYWGSEGAWHSLHFEACYYQGIDYCIREGLARFEPGTQGEHKLARGFAPTAVWSLHDIAHPAFRDAIAAYLSRERAAIVEYMAAADHHVPYRRTAFAGTLADDGPHAIAESSGSADGAAADE
jgi:uncharacterized protein